MTRWRILPVNWNVLQNYKIGILEVKTVMTKIINLIHGLATD